MGRGVCHNGSDFSVLGLSPNPGRRWPKKSLAVKSDVVILLSFGWAIRPPFCGITWRRVLDATVEVVCKRS